MGVTNCKQMVVVSDLKRIWAWMNPSSREKTWIKSTVFYVLNGRGIYKHWWFLGKVKPLEYLNLPKVKKWKRAEKL